jgi:hypothetical protein
VKKNDQLVLRELAGFFFWSMIPRILILKGNIAGASYALNASMLQEAPNEEGRTI